jgi:hypothetical protein
MDLKNIACERIKRIRLILNRIQRQALVNTVIQMLDPIQVGKFLH